MERPLAAAFCEAETTLTGAEAARIVGMNSNTAYSLITRLERAGFIEPVDSSGRSARSGKPYQVSEDLFRMWWQYRFDSEQLVRKVVQFLAFMYESDEPRAIHETLADHIQKGTCTRLFGDVCLKYVTEAIVFKGSSEYFELGQAFGLFAIEQAEFTARDRGLKKEAPTEKEIEKEIRRVKRQLELRGDDAAAWFELGGLCLQARDYPCAHQAFEKCVQIDSSNSKAWLKLGGTKYLQKDYKGAQEAAEKVLELDPPSAVAWFILGLTKSKLEDYKGAQEAYDKWVQLDPSKSEAWLGLGESKGFQGDHRGAQEA
jgi:cytochrome c-type biogenesis protein CcmH/NrfG